MVKLSAKALGKRKATVPAEKPAAKTKKSKGKSGSSFQSDDKPSREVGITGKPKRRPDQPKKIKLKDQKIIPVPRSEFAGKQKQKARVAVHAGSDDEDMDMDVDEDDESDEEEELEDMDVEKGMDGSFLVGLDENGLKRSSKETRRLHELHKSQQPIPKKAKTKSTMPAIPPAGSDSEDYDFDSVDDLESAAELEDGDLDLDLDSEDGDGESDLNEAFDDNASFDSNISDQDEDDDEVYEKRKKKSRDQEADYETSGRARWTSKSKDQDDEEENEVGRLPIKMPNGEVRIVAGTTRLPSQPKPKPKPVVDSEDDDEEDAEEESEDEETQAARMAGQKGKFGRMGVAEIVARTEWKNAQKLDAAKEQIAGIGAEILAGGELVDNAPLLTRLSTFALATVPSVEDKTEFLPVPASIRGLAFLSQLAVYKDIIPGYRIRNLTAQEEAEKVRDEVKRLREGEKMLVKTYKGYLKMLESEIKRRTPLSSLCVKCMCELLSALPHFNFSENIMGVLVGRVGRRTWDDDAEVVLQTFIDVFRADIAAVHSQTLVRLIARMIKERKFQVHPNILICILHLRLRTELDRMREKKVRASSLSKVEKKFKSELRKKWQTKNAKKREQEAKEEAKEMAEAAAEVNQEEVAQINTETLKNLFVLYFSILKHPRRSPLLPAALEGISHFAHFINIDFFRDLLAVLRRIILDQYDQEGDGEDEEEEAEYTVDPVGRSQHVRIRLLAIVTSFDILSGQGEAINIDLSDFINQLFTLIRPLSLDTGIEDPPLITTSTQSHTKSRSARPPVHLEPTSSLLFRCLHHVFFSKYASSPPDRAAAFAKRLSEAALVLPPNSARDALVFVRKLMAKHGVIEGLLDSEERMANGVYKGEMDDPQLTNTLATSFYEVEVLGRHLDRMVRQEAGKLADGNTVTV